MKTEQLLKAPEEIGYSLYMIYDSKHFKEADLKEYYEYKDFKCVDDREMVRVYKRRVREEGYLSKGERV